MVHLNVAGLSVDEDYTAHLFWPGEAEDTDRGMKLFAEAVCGEDGFERQHLVPASHYTESMAQEWTQAEHVDELTDLLTRLTVDGYMCQECVDIYRASVGGLKGLGRRYYPDVHGVEDGGAGTFDGLERIVGDTEDLNEEYEEPDEANLPEVTWDEYNSALAAAEEDGQVVPYEFFKELAEEADTTTPAAARWALHHVHEEVEAGD